MTVLAAAIPVLLVLLWRTGYDTGRRKRPNVYRHIAAQRWTITDAELHSGRLDHRRDDTADALAMAFNAMTWQP